VFPDSEKSGICPHIFRLGFSGKFKDPIHPKNKVLRQARLWIEFCSIRKAIFHTVFFTLGDPFEIENPNGETCPYFFSAIFRFHHWVKSRILEKRSQKDQKRRVFHRQKT